MESLSDLYRVVIDGKPVTVYSARVSAIPFNRLWPGYQRSLDQTELAAFASWDMDRPVEVEVTATSPVNKVIVRPRALGIVPTVKGNQIKFRLSKPATFTVEVNGSHHALHLFANAPEKFIPNAKDPNVIFFAPGIHEAGRLVMKSGQTVYLAPGAVVYGVIEARKATGIRVLGRGILDGSRFPRESKSWDDPVPPDPFGTMAFYECDGVEIDGVITRDPNAYNVTFIASRNVRVSNVKTVGSWRYNSDGIDFLNCQNCVIERCFVRSYDDSLVVTGLRELGECVSGHLPSENIIFRDCVIWNEWGRALEIGATCSAPYIRNILFQNCDVIHVANIAADVQNAGAAAVSNIRFENIRVELDDGAPAPQMQEGDDAVFSHASAGTYCPHLCVAEITHNIWSQSKQPGQVRDIVFKDIVATGHASPPSAVKGYDAGHRVEKVRFEHVVIEGRPVTDAATGFVTIGEHVSGVEFA